MRAVYQDMRERQCDGRRAAIVHNGALAAYCEFKDSWEFPAKFAPTTSRTGATRTLGYMIWSSNLDLSHAPWCHTFMCVGTTVVRCIRGGVPRSGRHDRGILDAVRRSSDNLLA